MRKLNNFFPIVVILFLSFWSIKPLFHSGFFPFHDDAQVQRVYEMRTSLSNGIFPVRWVADLGFGYGYPIFTFYAPLVYYIGGFFNLIGFDSLIATKIMIGMGMVLAGVSMYVLAREFWGRSGALISALLYLYAPYHAVNLYVRGAISELWAYGLLPFVFFGIYKVYHTILSHNKIQLKNKEIWLWISFTSIAYAAVIVAHNLTAMMITPFIFLESLFLFFSLPVKNYRTAIILFMSFIIGIMLAAFYWLPAILEMNYTNVSSIIGGGSDYKDHFVCLFQLWNSPWGYGGSAPGCQLDGLSFRLGKVHIILAIFSIISLVVTWRRSKKIFFSVALAIIGAVTSIFFLLDYSKFVWDTIPQMAYFQFPWRFLVLVSFFLSFLGGTLCILLPKKVRIVAVIIVGITIFFVNVKLFVPGKVVEFNANHYTNKSFLNWETSKISYEYMPKGFSIPQQKEDIPKNLITYSDPSSKILSLTAKTQSFRAVIDSSHATIIHLAIAYFPAWKLSIDGKQVPFSQFSQGLILKIPAGKHIIQGQYQQTMIEIIADLLSLTGVILLIIGIIAFRNEKPTSTKNI